MAKAPAHDWFSPLLLMMCIVFAAISATSGRVGMEVSSPMLANGSQWHVHVRYGVLRVLWAERDTDLAGLPAGARVEVMPSWRYEWGLHVTPQGSIRFVQIPLWFIALLLLTWFVVRSARRHMRLVSGVCPSCGKAAGGVAACPTCGHEMPRRMAR